MDAQRLSEEPSLGHKPSSLYLENLDHSDTLSGSRSSQARLTNRRDVSVQTCCKEELTMYCCDGQPNYLKYYERAREHLLGPAELVELWNKEGLGFVVYKCEMTFKEGAKFGDDLEIRTTPYLESKYRLTFDQQVWRKGGSKALVLGKVEMVCVDKSNRMVEIPSIISNGLNRMYGMKLQ